ncbi:MAG TPA: PIG-L family deacetylase [Bryobacteraceae bacterium]|nr:PIG-L family deacetylase [Bryobacteraceae bacterium]
MERRRFLQATAGSLPAFGAGLAQGPPQEIVIERPAAGRPHAGKVLAAIQPHADDISLFAAGTVAKLLDEGYTGYLIRVTNDDMAGPGTVGETVLANERDNQEVARVLGMKGVFNLNYSNHQMDGESRLEIRARFIFLFRLLKVDTIVCYDPWAHYEENPDHYVTAQCVEAACWMAGMDKDYPEHFAAGLQPHSVKERYYFARGPQLVNRIVDISATIEKKIEVNLANRAQGPAGESGARLRARLAKEGLRLPVLGDDDETANREYIRHFVLARDAELGRQYGLAYAEKFHYIGPEPSRVEDYIRRNAVPLGGAAR